MSVAPSSIDGMAYGCTAPVYGHRSSAAAARCPACRGGYGGYRRSHDYDYAPRTSSGSPGRSSSGGSSGGTVKTRRTRTGGSVGYSATEWRTVEPLTQQAERIMRAYPDRRDLFLCHAWDDRQDAAKEFYDLLIEFGATVWFSEYDVRLGKPLLREIDKGLANSRGGIVFVTPALLKSLNGGGIADKELSVLLATDRVIPVTHNTDFSALREVSPMLASRSGLSTGESSMRDVASKVAAAAAAEENVPA